MTGNLLEVRELKTYFFTDEGIVKAVDGVNLDLARGQTLGVVGESGCGKSITAQSIMRIEPIPGKVVGGEILWQRQENGSQTDLVKLEQDGSEIRAIRGAEIAMIFQEPMSSFSMVHTVGQQIMEAVQLHQDVSSTDARDIAVEMLSNVGIPDPLQRIDEYPFRLSGGMLQRAMIAMALSCNPNLLIADEPTTALDVTIQAQILNLLQDLQASFQLTFLFISHDLSVVEHISDRVAVMYVGKIVELAETEPLFRRPMHPYTEAVPRSDPESEKERILLSGEVADPADPPLGCAFHPRCPYQIERCANEEPVLQETEPGHFVSCHRTEELHLTGVEPVHLG